MDAMHHVFASFHHGHCSSLAQVSRIRLGPSWLITWHVFSKKILQVLKEYCIDRYMYPIYKELIIIGTETLRLYYTEREDFFAPSLIDILEQSSLKQLPARQGNCDRLTPQIDSTEVLDPTLFPSACHALHDRKGLSGALGASVGVSVLYPDRTEISCCFGVRFCARSGRNACMDCDSYLVPFDELM